MKKTLAILLALCMVLCMMPSAAFANPAGNTVTPVVSINSTSALYTGASISLKNLISVKEGENDVTGSCEIQWTYEGASVSEALNAGVYTATVKKDDTIIDTKSFEVKRISASNVEVKYDGYFTSEKTSLTDAEKENLLVTCSGTALSSGFYSIESVVTDSAKKNVTITIKLKDPRGNTEVSNVDAVEKFVSVPIKLSLNGYQIWYSSTTQSIPDQQYTGNALTPSVSVYYKGTETGKKSVLYLGTDYDIKYSNNTNKGSVATVSVTGKGDYSSGETITATFKIVGRPLTASGITYTVSSGVQNGTYPTIVIKDGTKTLVQAKDANGRGDYYVSSCTNSVVGTGKGSVTVVGMGNYEGSRSFNFDVTDPGKQLYSGRFANGVTAPSTYYNGSTQSPLIEVFDANGNKVSTGYYTIECQGTTLAGKSVTTLKDAGTYYIYAKGNYPYAGRVLIGSYVINPVPLDYAEIILSGYTTTYGGYTVPKVSVRHFAGNFYFPETDYTVSYRYLGSSSSYLKPLAVVTPVANGNLVATSTTKELTKEINYNARSISNCNVNFTDYRSSKNYDGTMVKPSVVVKDYSLNKTLVLNSDYTVTYKDAAGKTVAGFKDAGTYTVIITGIGAYSGTTSLTYTINGIDISGCTVTLKESSVKADGYNKVPVILSVKNGYYTTLSSADYTVSYEDAAGKTVYSMSTPGTYKVVVTGKNGYSGSTYATFRIVGTPQEIKIAKTSYKVYKDSDSFKINATATGDGTGFSYVSSNPEVATVSATGVVTIHKIGRAKITVTTTGMKKSEPASDDVYVKVYPDKTKITQKPQTEGNKGCFRVRWEKQDDVTYYEIRYARNSKFTSGTYLTKKVNASTLNYTTQSTKITGLKSGARYYVKVRAVKVVTNDYGQQLKYYGTWSNWRSVVTK